MRIRHHREVSLFRVQTTGRWLAICADCHWVQECATYPDAADALDEHLSED